MRELTTDLTVSAGRPADVAANAADAYARGFSILKIKLGTDIGADLQTLRELKAALPPDACLRLDANQGWTAAEALRAAELCTALGLNVDFLEQPTPCADLRALAEVTRGTELRVLADESGARPGERPPDHRDGQRGYGQHQAVQMRWPAPGARDWPTAARGRASGS